MALFVKVYTKETDTMSKYTSTLKKPSILWCILEVNEYA